MQVEGRVIVIDLVEQNPLRPVFVDADVEAPAARLLLEGVVRLLQHQAAEVLDRAGLDLEHHGHHKDRALLAV